MDQQEYRESIDQVLQFLNGNYDLILGDLQRKMEEASEAMEYERAIEYRDLLQSVQKIAQKQKITDTAGDGRDIVAMATRIWRMQSCRYSLCVMAD